MSKFDQLWSRVVKVLAFLMGMFIMYHETVVDKGQRPYLYAAAIALMGLQIAETLEKLIEIVGVILTNLGKKSDG